MEIANKKLIQEGVSIEKKESKDGDCKIIITSRKHRTVIGCNDLGVWLEKLEEKNE